MLAGVSLSDAIALMGKGQASWSKILEAMDYYGIGYASKAVYTTENEVEILTRMSRESFLSDVAFGGSGGPTGYDDFDFHLIHQKNGDLYSFLSDENIVGGAILKMDKGCLYIYRIFVCAKEFHKGYGLRLMQAIEDRFPEISLFKLDTPEWNIRTNLFYQKCGYTAVGKEHIPEFDLILYEKKRL